MTTRLGTPDILGGMLTGKAEPDRVPLDAIKTDGGTQMRAGLNQETIDRYADDMKLTNSWGEFPPVTVYYDGQTYWLADGFHRLAAYKKLQYPATSVPAVINAGNRRDAILHAAGANAIHGLPRTNDDKRRTVKRLLEDAEWTQWSNGAIAKACAVSDMLVGAMRKELTPSGLESTTRIGADGRTYNTANIGTNRPVTPKPTVAASPDFASPAVLKGIVARVWDTLNPMRDAALTMRMAAEARIGAGEKSGQFWEQCKAAMGDDIRAYRHTDLQSAIYGVVLDREMATWTKREAQPVATTQPAPRDRTHVLSDIRTWLYAHAGNPKEIVELGEALHYREFGHPQWDDMFPAGAENDDVYWALEQCIDEAAAKVPEYADGLPAPAPAPVFTFTPATEIVDDVEDDLPPFDAKRMERLLDTKEEFKRIVEDILPRFGDLTGRHTEALGAERELRHLLAILEREMDALDPNVTAKGVILA